MAKFKVGDKVRIVFGDGFIVWVSDMHKFIGKEATISEVSGESNHPWFRIAGHFFHWNECDAELIEQPRREFIVIHRSGNVMTAEHRVNREVIKSGTAICNASDTFDFETGAKLAFDRLMGREEPKREPKPAHRFKVGDRVVIKTTGKIGEVSAISTEIPFGCNILVAHENGFHSGDGFNVSVAKKEHDGKCEWFYPNNLSPAPAPEPPKFYTGKVVCYGCEAGTEWVYGALIGKIGTIKNGHATWRSGLCCEGYTSFDDFCARNKSGRWLEIKE